MRRVSLAKALGIFGAASLLSFSVSHAQDRDSEFYQKFQFTQVASYYLLNVDLIAIGEFGVPVEIGDDPLSLLQSREIDLDFRITTLLKGELRPGQTVKVRLRNDMLVYPGSELSRYEIRWQMYREAAERLRPFAAESEAVGEAYDSGRINGAQRYEQYQEIDARASGVMAEIDAWLAIQRTPFYSHGHRIDQIGGAIRSNEPYLVALRSVEGNVSYYSMTENSPAVWWSDAQNDLLKEMERLLASPAFQATTQP